MSSNSDQKILQLGCVECDSSFSLEFSVEDTDLDPTFCPFCGEPLEDEDVKFFDDDEDNEDEAQ